MTEPTQGELRTWARAQGMTVNDRGSLPLSVRVAYVAAQATSADSAAPTIPQVRSKQPAPVTSAAPAGTPDLATGLRDYLSSVETEVRAVTSLSERIDALVRELNGVRDEQVKRLAVLDELRASVTDPSLTAFLTSVIKPRRPRVEEVVPERLR